MDRVFLDANVIFSAVRGGRVGRLWALARSGRCVLLASPHVLEEARRNLRAAEGLEDRLSNLEIVPDVGPGHPCPVELPEHDRPVLMAAVAAGATHLLSGDRRAFGDLYRKRVLGVLILPPADYL